MERHQSNAAGAYLTGPIMPNPAALFNYSSMPIAAPVKPMTFVPADTVEAEISDADVSEAIERLTKAPNDTPESLQQAALDMELVIRHFDSLSEAFGPEAALTSLALDLASNGGSSRREEPVVKSRRKSIARRPRKVKQAA